jgi:flagellar hook-basal body complex protein FliE
MNFLTKIPRASLLNYVRASFSGNNWKDRDQSSEKVYISQEESTLPLNIERTLSKLLNKIDDSASNATEKEVTFQRELKTILKKHGVVSAAFEAEVNNLHKYL